jgi:hypothetical protein
MLNGMPDRVRTNLAKLNHIRLTWTGPDYAWGRSESALFSIETHYVF